MPAKQGATSEKLWDKEKAKYLWTEEEAGDPFGLEREAAANFKDLWYLG